MPEVPSDKRFIEDVRGDEPEIAEKLRIEERELEAGGDVVPARLTFPVKSGNL